MAIVNFTFRPSEVPDGAAAVRGVHHAAGIPFWPKDGSEMTYAEGPSAMWLWNTHVGLCLNDREMNGYHDSDFYMTVWNEEKGEPEEIMFATTRGWSYPSYGSNVDATPEVRAKYEAWQAKCRAERQRLDRLSMAKKRREMRSAIRTTIGTGDAFVRALRLRRQISPQAFDQMLTFLQRNIRSEFKKSLRSQIIAWFGETSPKYPRPLSPKQMQWIS